MMSNTILLLAVFLACMASQPVLAVHGATFGKAGAAVQEFAGRAFKVGGTHLSRHSANAAKFGANTMDAMKKGGAQLGDHIAHGAEVAHKKLGTIGVAAVSGLAGAGIVHAVHEHDKRVRDKLMAKILKNLRRNDE